MIDKKNHKRTGRENGRELRTGGGSAAYMGGEARAYVDNCYREGGTTAWLRRSRSAWSGIGLYRAPVSDALSSSPSESRTTTGITSGACVELDLVWASTGSSMDGREELEVSSVSVPA